MQYITTYKDAKEYLIERYLNINISPPTENEILKYMDYMNQRN